MKKEYIEVGNYFVEGFLRGAFDMEDIIPQVEIKLIEILPKFINNEENEIFRNTKDAIILIINRSIRLLALKSIDTKEELFNFNMDKYLDWSQIKI
ncbi:hypothetical protein [Clostridium beijerinckii]|uniref:hypothetical protein n=1 Tax=Clostridium beijerinckii TaxID=1520 RepID=UPI00156D56EB|nr:hypothetical protein [Clostridium beijerinckii]NRU52460.1 hypothetical protein [Clostridium beijerinckii]NYC69095.1 hypothetical protein [Clostridium beijerinckii]